MPNVEDQLTQMQLDVPTAVPTTMRATGFRHTDAAPPLLNADVTRIRTSIGPGASAFADSVRRLITSVQSWLTTAPLQPHEVFLLGRRLERLRLASHAPGRSGGFAQQAARAALAALPVDRIPPEVATAARQLAQCVAQGGLGHAPGTASEASSAAVDEKVLKTSARARVAVLPLVLFIALTGFGTWWWAAW